LTSRDRISIFAVSDAWGHYQRGAERLVCWTEYGSGVSRPHRPSYRSFRQSWNQL